MTNQKNLAQRAVGPILDQDGHMDHVTVIPTGEQLNYTFGGAEPVMPIKPSAVLTLWTEDADGGRATSIDDKVLRGIRKTP